MATTAQLGILVLLLLACTAVANVPDLGGTRAVKLYHLGLPPPHHVHATSKQQGDGEEAVALHALSRRSLQSRGQIPPSPPIIYWSPPPRPPPPPPPVQA